MYLNKTTIVRINEEQLKKMSENVNKHPDIYFNVSHFLRCAIMRELKRCENVKSKR